MRNYGRPDKDVVFVSRREDDRGSSPSDYSCIDGTSCDPTKAARLRCAWG
jgi:hypothetical protein